MKWSRIFFLACLFAISGICRVNAEESSWFSFRIEQPAAYREDTVTLRVHMEENDLPDPIAGFRVTVEYDGDQLTMKRVKNSGQMQSGALRNYIGADRTVSVYVCDGNYAPNLQGDCITFELVVNQEADPGETMIFVEIDQIVDWSGYLYEETCKADLSLEINPPLSSKAELETLKPSIGSLEPDFSPEILEYRLPVPAETDAVDFTAKALESGIVRINRRKLLRAGSTTEITVAVTSQDGQEKAEYFIYVDREEKAEEQEEPEQPVSSAEVFSEPSSSQAPFQVSSVEEEPEEASSQASQEVPQAEGTPPEKSSQSFVESETEMKGESDESPVALQAPATPTVIYGDRNLYIVGGQDSSMMLGILIVCVCVLIVVTAVVGNSHKKNKN